MTNLDLTFSMISVDQAVKIITFYSNELNLLFLKHVIYHASCKQLAIGRDILSLLQMFPDGAVDQNLQIGQ